MTVSLKAVGAITMFVSDVGRSRAWYGEVFDRPVVFEDEDSVVFKFDNLVLNLLRIGAADELIAPAEVAVRHSGASSQLTIWVDDADATCSQLMARGVVLINGPMDREWGQRTACFADPDGHLWEIAQTL